MTERNCFTLLESLYGHSQTCVSAITHSTHRLSINIHLLKIEACSHFRQVILRSYKTWLQCMVIHFLFRPKTPGRPRSIVYRTSEALKLCSPSRSQQRGDKSGQLDDVLKMPYGADDLICYLYFSLDSVWVKMSLAIHILPPVTRETWVFACK